MENTIHEALAKSYLAYFLASLIGLFVDSFIDLPITVPFAKTAAIICFGAGPLLMLWAQYTSRHENSHPSDHHYFRHGPYRLMRNPTHLGLLILVTGYTLVSGSVVFFGTMVLGYFISNNFFFHYESLLEERYGEHYQAYKADVKKIL